MAGSVYDVPVKDILKSIGCEETGRNMFRSPFRDEKVASLHVNPVKNVWYDHGLGKGGNNVELVMMIRNCSVNEAIKFLNEFGNITSIQPRSISRNTVKSNSEVKSIKEIHSDYLCRFLSDRHIPIDLAQKYCKEVYMHSRAKDRDYLMIGFENNNGCYALSSPSGIKLSTGAGITTINNEGVRSVLPSTKSVSVFEGFFDFLSWQVLQNNKTPSCDALVLNSVNNLMKASEYLKAHEQIIAFLDNDPAGRKCLEDITSMCQGAEINNMSSLYQNYKDLNEFLQDQRGFAEEMDMGR